jgi:hypothetical protein
VAGQRGNRINASVPVVESPPASGMVIDNDTTQATVAVPAPAPVRQINGSTLRNLGARYHALYLRYASERIPAEQRWLKNLRQYLGIYDPAIERTLPPNRSRAYPRLTRVKCISMLSRLMNLMFPGNETNWELNASPSPEMSPTDVAQAVSDLMTELQGSGQPVQLTQSLVDEAVRRMADKVAAQHTTIINDQLLELGGDQTRDWIGLNRQIVDSGIKYGIGVLEGPYVRKITTSGWVLQAEATTDPTTGQQSPGGFKPVSRDIYKPQFNFLPVWDFYPDMSARDLPGEGYFVRKILGRSALRKLADRKDFFSSQIKAVLATLPGGNFKAKSWETELKTMGLSAHSETSSASASGREKYEVIIWKGPVSAQTLMEAGADVPESMRVDDVDAELWMIDQWIIKAEVNAWVTLGATMKQAHIFQFDEDDTSPIGQGLPSIVRDSQLSICAATRMVLDNASVVCGPQFEINTALMRPDQDLTAIEAYKNWYRDDDGLTAQFPAIRRIEIDAHLAELQGLVKMFMEFAEVETFIGPQTGGDMTQMPSEPMRTAAGASMARGDAALPFKDIVRNYDSFTQSVIWSMVGFNKKFNPDLAPEGDLDVIPRGATSLVAKEIRGAQIDQLSQTLTPDERDHIDERKFLEAKMGARDLLGMLLSPDEAARNKDGRAQVAAKQAQQQSDMLDAQIKKVLADALKGVAQAQKNTAGAQGESVDSALKMIESGQQTDEQGQGSGAGQPAA